MENGRKECDKMAYTKTNWVNDSVPAINAFNLNKIEEGIFQAHQNIDILKSAYDVGSIYITNTNIDPATIFGFGTWEVIDKEFKSQFLPADAGIFTHNTTNVSESSAVAVLGGHTLRVRVTAVNKVALSDTNKELGTINLDKVGVSNFVYTLTSNGSCTDDTSIPRVSVTHNTGLITHLGTIGDSTIAIDETINIDFTVPLIAERMLDEFCDKFYWKRIA